ncbi:MAG: lysylphosphatidylglycerol synthase transmembrane domain-containing protein [Candidatus Binatia bacterium]
MALAILAWCALFLDLGQTVSILGGVSTHSILFILGLWTVDRLLMAWKWAVLLEAQQIKVGFGSLVRIYYQATLASIFLPSSIGGDLLRAHWVSRKTGATHQVYASLLMEKTIGLLSAGNWAVIGIAVFLFRLPEAPPTWSGIVFISVLVVNGLFLISLQPRVHALILNWHEMMPQSRLLSFFERLYKAYCHYRQQRRALLWNGLLTVVEQGLQLLVILIMARSLGFEQNAIVFLAVTSVYLLIYRFPIAPDGWGINEATAIGLYGLIGVSPESAFALAFLAHVMQLMVVLPGLWFYSRSSPPPLCEAEQLKPS